MYIIDLNTIKVLETEDIFRRIDSIDSSSFINIDGRWNYKGKSKNEAEKYIYFDGSSYKYGVVQYNTEEIRNEGEYKLNNGELNFFTGNPIDYINISTDSDLSFRLSDDQLVLIGGFWDDDYFLREDAIGTANGESALLRTKLFVEASWISDNYIMFFLENGIFLFKDIKSANEQVWNGDEEGGTWEVNGNTIILKWSDGVIDNSIMANDSFEVQSIQEVFSK